MEKKLRAVLAAIDAPVVAVSGGVDSMTLAYLAHQEQGTVVYMVHAISPAVPADATARVRAHASRHGWRLETIDAGEFTDLDYRANPVNRCYFCKTNLYGEIAARFAGTILSGTNTDDLGDFRPGLKAAAEHGVRHPFVEAGLAKVDVRAQAQALDLHDLAELPAAPCLSSRVETGIRIDPADLALVDSVERQLRSTLGAADIRCRITAHGVRIELSGDTLDHLLLPTRSYERSMIEAMIAEAGRSFLGYAPYRRGSAFLRDRHHA
jgi:uncharacterized protein